MRSPDMIFRKHDIPPRACGPSKQIQKIQKTRTPRNGSSARPSAQAGGPGCGSPRENPSFLKRELSQCSPGTVAAGSGHTACEPCPLGTFHGEAAATACISCEGEAFTTRFALFGRLLNICFAFLGTHILHIVFFGFWTPISCTLVFVVFWGPISCTLFFVLLFAAPQALEVSYIFYRQYMECSQSYLWTPWGPSYDHICKNIYLCKG